MAGGYGDLVNPISNVLANKLNRTAVINMGVWSDSIELIDARKSDVLKYNPAAIICEFGTNNLGNDASFSYIQSRMANLYSYFKNTAKASVWALTIVPSEFEVPGNPSGIYYNSHAVRMQLNDWIRSHPANVDIVTDAWTLVRDPNDELRFAPEYRGITGPPEQFFGYTNHWNQAGVNLVASHILIDLANQ